VLTDQNIIAFLTAAIANAEPSDILYNLKQYTIADAFWFHHDL
jgi:hypothetical protein